MQINVTVADIDNVDLTAVVGEHRTYDHDAEEYVTRDKTLGDVVAEKVTAHLTKDDSYPGLRKRFFDLRDEEIREQVRPIVAKVIAEPVQKTTHYGDPVGPATTLTELIVTEAKALLTNPVDQYNRSSETFIQKLVREQVNTALTKELSAVLAEEKAKVVAAVQAKAGELVAEAVKKGLGR